MCAGDDADHDAGDDAEDRAPSGNPKDSAVEDLAPSEEAASDAEGQVLDIVSEPPMKKLRQDGDDPHEEHVTAQRTPTRTSRDREPPVPVGTLPTARLAAPPAAAKCLAPMMPAIEQGENADVRKNMRDIVPYVLHYLRDAIVRRDDLKF